MTGIGNTMLCPGIARIATRPPQNVRQVISGFASNDRDQKNTANVSKMKRALKTGCESLVSNEPVSVIDSMKLYSMALKKQRESSNNTVLAKKKVKYSFKSISSKIISSKTSTAAREAVSQAKREIVKLKAARRSGKYDEEELAAALDHAKSMERIARRKARHLEEEEMAKRCSADSKTGGVVVPDDTGQKKEDPVREEIRDLRDDIGRMQKTAENEEYIESEGVTNEMIRHICDGMEEILNSIEDLNDLMDELVGNPRDMEAEDIDAMRIKHRNKEMKEITKADAEYMKAMFEHFESERAAINVVL